MYANQTTKKVQGQLRAANNLPPSSPPPSQVSKGRGKGKRTGHEKEKDKGRNKGNEKGQRNRPLHDSVHSQAPLAFTPTSSRADGRGKVFQAQNAANPPSQSKGSKGSKGSHPQSSHHRQSLGGNAASEMLENDKLKAAVAAVEAEAITAYKLKQNVAKGAMQRSNAQPPRSSRGGGGDGGGDKGGRAVRRTNSKARVHRLVTLGMCTTTSSSMRRVSPAAKSSRPQHSSSHCRRCHRLLWRRVATKREHGDFLQHLACGAVHTSTHV